MAFPVSEKTDLFSIRNFSDSLLRDETIVNSHPSPLNRLSEKFLACPRGGGVFPCADGPTVTVHKDRKSPSKVFCWNANGRGVGVKNRENLPTS